jgi:hypothetical protein
MSHFSISLATTYSVLKRSLTYLCGTSRPSAKRFVVRTYLKLLPLEEFRSDRPLQCKMAKAKSILALSLFGISYLTMKANTNDSIRLFIALSRRPPPLSRPNRSLFLSLGGGHDNSMLWVTKKMCACKRSTTVRQTNK